jgi:hypothetical protein
MDDPTPAELMRAQGHLLVFLSALLERRGLAGPGEISKLLKVYADVVAETESGEGAILAYWAAVTGQRTPH